VILEGALAEGRAGQLNVARCAFEYLYGPPVALPRSHRNANSGIESAAAWLEDSVRARVHMHECRCTQPHGTAEALARVCVRRDRMLNVSWYGPVYHEAAMFEEKLGNVHAAIAIAERGRHSVPRYGPLWFDLLRLQEKAFPLAVEPRRRLSQVRCAGEPYDDNGYKCGIGDRLRRAMGTEAVTPSQATGSARFKGKRVTRTKQ